jgi:hypothetical protein
MIDAFDILALIGLVLFGIGLWLVAPALSLSAVGAVMLAVGLLGARIARPAKRGKS